MTTSQMRNVVVGASLAAVLLGGGLVVAGSASANAQPVAASWATLNGTTRRAPRQARPERVRW